VDAVFMHPDPNIFKAVVWVYGLAIFFVSVPGIYGFKKDE